MKTLAGRSVLEHVLRRCEAVAGVDTVCCATTTDEADDAVADLAAGLGVQVVRGSQTDVLDRYHRAAIATGAEVVLRITSDCPLIDPVVCADLLWLRREAGADFAAMNVPLHVPRTWPHGLECEAFTRDLLARAAATATDPEAREHVSPWMREQTDVAAVNLAGPGGEAADMCWTLDYPEDFAFLEALFARLPPPPALPGWREVLAVVRAHPALVAMNRRRI